MSLPIQLHTFFSVRLLSFVPATVLCLLTMPCSCVCLVYAAAAALPRRRQRERLSDGRRLAVVLLAYDEEDSIVAAIKRLLADKDTWFEVFVVARSCSDQTVAHARDAGAQVLRPVESSSRYASIRYGLQQALHCGAGAVLLLDASSVASPGVIARVAATIAGGAGAVQLWCRRPGVSLWATGYLRLRGRERLGLPCELLETGFAFSAEALARVPYLAEDRGDHRRFAHQLLASGVRLRFLDEVHLLTARKASSLGGDSPSISRLPSTLGVALPGQARSFFLPIWCLLSRFETQVSLLLILLILPMHWTRFFALAGMIAQAVRLIVEVGLFTAQKRQGGAVPE